MGGQRWKEEEKEQILTAIFDWKVFKFHQLSTVSTEM